MRSRRSAVATVRTTTPTAQQCADGGRGGGRGRGLASAERLKGSASSTLSRTPSLLDHLIGPLQERRRDREAEGLGGLEVDHELELGGLLHGKVGRLGTLRNLVDVDGGATPHIDAARPIANQATGRGKP